MHQVRAFGLPKVSEGSPIPCCIDVEPGFAAKARYALRQLLVPLGLRPQWVSPDEATGGLYYGPRPHGSAAVRLQADLSAPHFFDSLEPYDAQQATWFDSAEGHLPAMFATASGEPDLISSTFLWISGWQEHVTPTRDAHGRVPYSVSLAARTETADRPVVDGYRSLLERRLRGGGIQVRVRKWAGRDWALCPTHDVDYLKKWRPGILYREFIQDLLLDRRGMSLRRRLGRASEAVRQMAAEDPYRGAIRRMHQEVRRRGGTATYFLKAGGDDPHDVPYDLADPFLAERIREMHEDGFEVGLHPSYRAYDDGVMLEEEARRLSRVVGEPVTTLRHHYLRFDPVRTPLIHNSLGMQIDSTIGFAEHEGFRRGTCLPFQLYDLASDAPLDTWEMPLAVMDSALFTRRQLELSAAVDVTRKLSDACRRYGGALVGLWHNVLGDDLEAPGWDKHFERTLDYAVKHGAAITSLTSALENWK